jgi:hypothetical protein
MACVDAELLVDVPAAAWRVTSNSRDVRCECPIRTPTSVTAGSMKATRRLRSGLRRAAEAAAVIDLLLAMYRPSMDSVRLRTSRVQTGFRPGRVALSTPTSTSRCSSSGSTTQVTFRVCRD